jgi:hypothetical protein
MDVAWRVALGTACAGLALGLFIAYGPEGSSQAAAPAPTTPATTQSTTAASNGPLEATLEIGEQGIAEPVSLSVGAGKPIKLTVTVPFLAHLALVGDDEAGGFLEVGTSTLEFTVKKPGTYPMQLHTDAPEPFELGELVVVP